MSNNKVTPEKVERVYVPVSVKDRMPKEDDNRYFVILENGEHNVSFPIYELNKFPRGITHWLEEKPLSDLLPKAGGVDLKAMEERFDILFDTETVESFELWLKEKRFKEPAGEQPGKPENWKDTIIDILINQSETLGRRDEFMVLSRNVYPIVADKIISNVVQPLQEELKERAAEFENLEEETENRIRALQKQLNRERDEALRLSARKEAEIERLRDENIKLMTQAERVKATFREA